MSEIRMEIGDRDGMVVIHLAKPTDEITITPEVARQIAETLARSAYSAAYNLQAPENKSKIAERIRGKLLNRITHVIRSLQEQGKPPLYIANHVVDTVMSEML